MTKYLLSIDPGKSTGVALLSYGDGYAPELVEGWQFPGGLAGLLEWLNIYWYNEAWDYYNDEPGEPTLQVVTSDGKPRTLTDESLTIIAEKFTARNTKGFAYTTDALEPLRCEGALISQGLMPDYDPKEKKWRDPSLQYLVGGKDKADKKKRQHRFLKETGFYRTGKDLLSPDADDFRSAAAHGLAYLSRGGDKPTFRLISDWIGGE